MKIPFALTATCICLLCSAVRAQSKKPGFLLGANLMYSSPASALSNNYKSGVGAEVAAGIGLGKTYLVASYGSTRFLSRAGSKDMTIKPLKFGLRQFILGKNVFIHADAGTAVINDRTKGIIKNDIAGAIGAGVRLAGLEAGVFYNTLGNGSNNNYHFMQYKFGWSLAL